jgi:metallopeptidase MepB
MTAKFDMAVHNPATHEALLNLDEVQLYNDLHEKFLFHRLPETSYYHVLYTHIVIGMDAGYYSYVW